MTLVESYSLVKKGIVAFVPLYHPLKSKDDPLPVFPPIFGTGFIVNENGLIATNYHVAAAADRLFKPADAPRNKPPFVAILFKIAPHGLLQIPLEVLGAFKIQSFITGKVYYGPPAPDIAVVHVKAKGLPIVELDGESPIEEGAEIATSGFPMGTDALTAPGWLHQLTPTLQRGIISAVLPFPGAHPHAFTINVMIQGGASGSPVFLPSNGKVIGVLYGALTERNETIGAKDKYSVPTNISYVVPARYLTKALDLIKNDPNFRLPDDAQSIDQMITTGTFVNRFESGGGPYQIRSVETTKELQTKVVQLNSSGEPLDGNPMN